MLLPFSKNRHRVGTDRCAPVRLARRVLDERRAAEIVDRIDLRKLPICLPCHLELAFALLEGKPRRAVTGLVTRTAFAVWSEIASELEALLRRAQMRGAEWAIEAQADLQERGARSWIVRVIVTRVAIGMAHEMRERQPLTRVEPTFGDAFSSIGS